MNRYSVIWSIFWLLAAYGALVGCCMHFGGHPFHFQLPFLIAKTGVTEWLKFSVLGSFALFMVLGIACNPFWFRTFEYGGAAWATPSMLENIGLTHTPGGKTGIILAEFRKKFLILQDFLCVLVFAGPGSGKTAGVIIPSVLNDDQSILVHDTKGEIYKLTQKHRAKFSKVFKWAPADEDSVCWNPLASNSLPDVKKWSQVAVHVSRLATAFFPDEGENKESHWKAKAETFFKFWALALIHEKFFGESTETEVSIGHVLRAATSGDPKKLIAQRLELHPELPEDVKHYGHQLINSGEQEFLSISSTFSKNLDIFNDEIVRNNTSGRSDFDLHDFRQKRCSLYVVVQIPDIKRLRPILTAFFDNATSTFLENETSQIGVTLYMDEFVQLGKMISLQRLPAIGRSFKVRAVYVLQSFSQLKQIYGDDGASELEETCKFHVYYALAEEKQQAKVSKLIGNYTAKKRNTSRKGGINSDGNKTVGESHEGRPLILPQELGSLNGQIASLGPIHGKALKINKKKPTARLVVLGRSSMQNPICGISANWFLYKKMLELVNA